MGRGRFGRQRHQGEGPAAGVELGREVAVRQAVGEKRGQGALPVSVGARLEPGGATRHRIPAVGPDDEPGRDRAPVFQPRPDGVGGEIVGGGAGDALDAGERERPRRRAFGPSCRFRYSSQTRRARFPRAWNSIGRDGNSVPVSSTRRSDLSGAASARNCVPRPRESRKAAEWSRRATVRPRPVRSPAPLKTTSKPARAKPRAAASPASPAPATRTSEARAARGLAVGHR